MEIIDMKQLKCDLKNCVYCEQSKRKDKGINDVDKSIQTWWNRIKDLPASVIIPLTSGKDHGILYMRGKHGRSKGSNRGLSILWPRC